MKKHGFEVMVESTELHTAIADQDWEKFVRLIKEGADLNPRDHAGVTPLILAARGEKLEFFKALLKKGANLNREDCWGFTAMDWCVVTGKPEWLRVCKQYNPKELKWKHAMKLYKNEDQACQKRGQLGAALHGVFQGLNQLNQLINNL